MIAVWGRLVAVVFAILFVGPCVAMFRIAFGRFFTGKKDLRSVLYRLLCRMLRVRIVSITGERNFAPMTIFVMNHISYTDIILLGSILPVRFVSKDDIRKWPVIGWVAKSFGTLFVSRSVRRVAIGVEQVRNVLAQGDSLVLFPEGTTSDGCRVLPFKSSYFELPDEVIIQPISLSYVLRDGLSMTRYFRKMFSWRGELSMFEHMLAVFPLRELGVRMHFHQGFKANKPRKELALLAHEKVSEGFYRSMFDDTKPPHQEDLWKKKNATHSS